jgi:hypothetical protein
VGADESDATHGDGLLAVDGDRVPTVSQHLLGGRRASVLDEVPIGREKERCTRAGHWSPWGRIRAVEKSFVSASPTHRDEIVGGHECGRCRRRGLWGGQFLAVGDEFRLHGSGIGYGTFSVEHSQHL